MINYTVHKLYGLKKKPIVCLCALWSRTLVHNNVHRKKWQELQNSFGHLSYEYINDCLRAGLVYRREFYNDSEIEPENSLMFKITLSPFGDVFSPSFSN